MPAARHWPSEVAWPAHGISLPPVLRSQHYAQSVVRTMHSIHS